MADKPARGRLVSVGSALLGLAFAGALLAGDQLSYLGLTGVPVPPTPPALASASPTPEMAAPTPVPTAEATSAPTPTSGPTATPAPTATPLAHAKPVRLKIPKIGVDAPVIEVGLLPDGELEAPLQAHQVGWYAQGPRPGNRGNALLDGHVDWARSTAVFWFLGQLEPSDEVFVETADGQRVRFVVEWKNLYEVGKAPLAQIFGPTPDPSITLITCGGQFDRTSKSYTHRWVVRGVARPATPSPAH